MRPEDVEIFNRLFGPRLGPDDLLPMTEPMKSVAVANEKLDLATAAAVLLQSVVYGGVGEGHTIGWALTREGGVTELSIRRMRPE